MREVGDKMAALGEKNLAFGQQRYQETMPLYQQMVSSNVQGQQLAQELARDAAKERLKYRALEDAIIQDVQQFDQRGRQDRFAGQAAADTQQALATQRGIANRNLTRMGINPNSARFAALNDEFALRGAGATAGAKTNARFAAEQMGFGLKNSAAAIGRNLPATALSGISTAANVGGQTSALLNSQNTPMFQGFQGAMGGLQGQMNSIQGAGNLINQGYQNQLAAYNADGGALGGLGQIAGMAAGYFLKDGGVVGKDGKVDMNEDRAGGKIVGPGTGTSDSVKAINVDTGEPIRLSNGEYVIRAERVRELGKAFFDELNEGKKPSDGRRRKAIRKA
jgi:hypothetical protein